MRTRPIAMVALLALGGCATSGTGRGMFEPGAGKPGEAPGAVLFDWRAEADATNGQITATLPDGRLFRGAFVQETSATQVTTFGDPYLNSYGYMWPGGYGMHSDAPYWAHYGTGGTTTVRNYSGIVRAVLEGPGGERMSCEFTLARPNRGPAAGGTGTCTLEGGERVTNAVLRGE